MYGVWSYSDAEESSNYREMNNCITSIRKLGEMGKLQHSMLLFCTDNSTVETALYKGTSSSPKLLELVIEFYDLQFKFGFNAIISHISGKRMIAQGSDGLSRGAINEGVMNGKDYMSFIPFHLTAFEREDNLKDWVSSWLEPCKPIFLTPEDWFYRAHDIVKNINEPSNLSDWMWRPNIQPGVLVWTPPPAIADVAIEQLRKARLKRHNSLHVILVPQLMTPYWRKELYKCCDLVFQVPPICPYWSESMYEPLTIGICFPYIHIYPFSLRGTPKLCAIQRDLHQMWKNEQVDTRHILRELCSLSRRLRRMSRNMVRKMLYFESSC